MNIVYLTNHLNVGGITSYVLTLACGMKKRGHNVYIASSAGSLLPRFAEEGIIYLPLPLKTKSEISPKVFISRSRLLKYLRGKNIDIIHANTRVTQVLSFLIRSRLGAPYVWTCHGFFKRRFFRRVFPCCGDRVIAISGPVKEHLVNDFGVNEKIIRVIHSGIDIEKFSGSKEGPRTEAKRALGLSEGPVVGTVARLSEEKGHIYLIRAMRDVVGRIPAAQLIIVGEGRMKGELLKLVGSCGLGKSAFILPPAMQTPQVLAAMDLFVLPSLKEGLGLALMEAMASGLAVVGSDVGGIKSLIQDGYTGLLVEAADSAGLSSAILKLLQEPDKAKYLGDNARTFINENFSQEKMISQTEGVYAECLSAKS